MYNVGDSFEIRIDEVIDTQDGKLYKIQGFKSLVFDEYGLDKLNQLYTTRSTEDVKKTTSTNKNTDFDLDKLNQLLYTTRKAEVDKKDNSTNKNTSTKKIAEITDEEFFKLIMQILGVI